MIRKIPTETATNNNFFFSIINLYSLSNLMRSCRRTFTTRYTLDSSISLLLDCDSPQRKNPVYLVFQRLPEKAEPQGAAVIDGIHIGIFP